jgi:hypothetical protein
MPEQGYLISESLLGKIRKTTRFDNVPRNNPNANGYGNGGQRVQDRYLARITGKYTGSLWTPTHPGATYTGSQVLTDSNGDFQDNYIVYGDETSSYSFPPIIDIQSLSSFRDNKDNDDLYRIPINSIVEVFTIPDINGIVWHFTAGPANESFWAKITGESGGFYSWTMLDDDGVTEHTITGSVNAKEVQGRTGISTGEIVRMWPDASTDNTLFCFVCHSADDSGSVDDASYTGEHSETASTGIEWDRSSQSTNRGVKRTLMTGVAYYDTSDATLYGYVADFEYDANGHLVSISEERRVTIEVPQTCD